MGFVPATPKITLEAYLTQKGRYYLVFSGTTEQITISYFGLGDPDCNYLISSNDVGGGEKNILPSITDISGDHDCIKSLSIQHQKYILTQPKDNSNNFINFNSNAIS